MVFQVAADLAAQRYADLGVVSATDRSAVLPAMVALWRLPAGHAEQGDANTADGPNEADALTHAALAVAAA